MAIDRGKVRRLTRPSSYLLVFLAGLVIIYLLRLPELWASALLTLLAGAVLVACLGFEVGWGYLDLELPTRRDQLTIVGTIVGYGAVLVVVTLSAAALSPGATPADHQVLDPTPSEPASPSTPSMGQPTSSPTGTGTPTDPDDHAPSDPDRLVPLLVVATLAAPLTEELIFRNGMQKALTSRIGGPLAILLTSLTFAALHGPSYADSALSTLSLAIPLTIIFLTSVLLGLAYWKTENLLVPIAVHALMNLFAVIGSAV